MSRFVDRTASRTVPIGPCDCPGTPHERDEMVVRAELSGQDIADFINAPDGEATAAVIAKFIVSWNLLGPDGKPTDPTTQALLDLTHQSLQPVVKGITDIVNDSAKRGAPPNGSSAPSPSGTRGSGSRTRRTPTTG